MSGAFILTPLPVALFTRLQLFVAMEGSYGKDRRSIQPIEGEVVRRTGDGIAIEWKEFGNAIFLAMGEVPGRISAEMPGRISDEGTRSEADLSPSSARKAR